MDRGVEMPKINQEEYEKIKLLPDYDWNWIAREKTGKILSFTNKPTKTDEVWKDKQTRLWFNHKDSQLFQFIQCEDEEPYEIAELIREYEIKELRLAPSGTVIVDSFDESEETEVKDIEELKSWFEDDKLYVGEYVKHKINQLDESIVPKQGELETKIQELIESYKQEEDAYSNPENGWISGFIEDLKNLVEKEPLYCALIKGHELIDTGRVYWDYDKSDNSVFISELYSLPDNFITEMSKSEWNELGINDSNADFVKVDEELN